MACEGCPRRWINTPVWSYWTGPQPAIIGLCQETLRRNSPTAVVMDDSYWHWPAYSGQIPPETILSLAPNLRSDILRAWLLSQYGGIWIDADAIVWRDLRAIARHFRRYDFVAYRHRSMGLCSALIAARPGSPLAAAYWQAVCNRVADGGKLAELSLGPRLLRHTIAGSHDHRLRLLPPNLVPTIGRRQSAPLVQNETFSVRPGSWCFMLTHRPLVSQGWCKLDRQQILDSPTMLGRLFRQALH